MLKLNDKKLWKFERDLARFAKNALPRATVSALNGAAFETQRLARENVREKMVERTPFSRRSIQVERATTSRMEAAVGSVADYMADQEFGATRRKKGAQGVPIPTSYSAGQGEKAAPRTRLPREPNRMGDIVLTRPKGRPVTRKARNAQAIRQAAASTGKVAFIDTGRARGLFRVLGGGDKLRIKMLWDMSRDAVRVPVNPWLAPAVDDGLRSLPRHYRKALRFQAKRRGLFGR